jgi:hypothetical protein
MSCYFRHLKAVLDEAGMEVTRDNKRQIDEAIHHVMDVTYKDCPTTWRKLKQDILSDAQKRRAFIEELTKAIH